MFDPNQGDFAIDGIAGVRTSSFPSVDIANGSPSGGDATDEIVLSWPDTAGILGQYSTNGGNSWSTPTNLAESSDHVNDDAAVAISPDGSVVYVTYDAYAQPWQTTTASPRLEQGVVREGSASLTGFVTLHRGVQGDARGSSTNGIGAEFLGDYNYTAAQRIVNVGAAPTEFAVAVWNDSRNSTDCPAIDTYRENLFLFLTGAASSPPAKPYPGDCPAGFGNSDIYGGRFTP